MTDGFYVALSALDGFSKAMAVAANNIANASTGGFKKGRAVLEEGQSGGVEVSVREIDDLDHPVSCEGNSAEQAEKISNVDIAEEMTHMVTAQSGYKANLKSLRTQEEFQGSILDILG